MSARAKSLFFFPLPEQARNSLSKFPVSRNNYANSTGRLIPISMSIPVFRLTYVRPYILDGEVLRAVAAKHLSTGHKP